MKILVLENDPQVFAAIQQALGRDRFSVTPIISSEQAWMAVESGESRFLIADWDTSDIRKTQFISRVRAVKPPTPLYILLIAADGQDESLAGVQADDVLQRPFAAAELKGRVSMGERILLLSARLAMAREQLESQAMFDSLTGFMNRAAFLRQSAGELERARRASLPVSLISLDLDKFKSINDSFGSQTGDEVLRIVAQVIREKSRPYDGIGRWGGDEFVIFVNGVIGVDAEKIAERIIGGVRAARIEVANEAPLNVKMSAGIASIARISASTEVEPMIEQARQAMARAKEAGGNQVFLTYI
jgi:diguanylate cyclase (GGDEF)-like protein